MFKLIDDHPLNSIRKYHAVGVPMNLSGIPEHSYTATHLPTTVYLCQAIAKKTRGLGSIHTFHKLEPGFEYTVALPVKDHHMNPAKEKDVREVLSQLDNWCAENSIVSVLIPYFGPFEDIMEAVLGESRTSYHYYRRVK